MSRTTRVSRYQKGKTNLKQETVSGSDISWAICKSAPRSRQITTPAPHHSVFYRPDALPATQPTATKHWRHKHSRLAWPHFHETGTSWSTCTPNLKSLVLSTPKICPGPQNVEISHVPLTTPTSGTVSNWLWRPPPKWPILCRVGR